MVSPTLTLLVGALVLLVIYYVKTYTYWKRHNIPTPSGSLSPLGHLWPVYILTGNLTDHFASLYKKCEKHSMFGIYDLFTPILVVRELQLIKTVLQSNFGNFHKNGLQINPKKDRLLALHPVFADGETWSTSRKRLAHAFSNSKLKTLFVDVLGVCKKQQAFLDKHLNTKNRYECEMKHIFGRFMAEALANATLGVEGYSYEEILPPNTMHTIGHNMFNPDLFNTYLTSLALMHPNLTISLGIPFLPKEMEVFFRRAVHENLAIRLQDKTPRNDFFQLMIEMEKAKGKEGVNEERIVADTIALYLAGFESSRLILAFVVHELVVHPEIQEKVRDEIKSVLAKNNGEMTFEGLKEMKYMEQVINESLRHNSTVVYMSRICTEPYDLTGSDGLSVKMKPGMTVAIPVNSLHHDPQYWSDPELFDPDRFSDERKQHIEKMSFLPFGEGPRICIGIRLAMLTMKCCLISLLNNYKVELSPKTTLPLQTSKYHFFTEPITGFWVYISKL